MTNGNIIGAGDVYYIIKKNDQISQKYILALLNSKPYYLWLYHRGKRKGETLELYQKPLSEIPIKKISEEEQKPFIETVDKTLVLTGSPDYLSNSEKQAKVKDYEKQIDQLVYKLYGLTPEKMAVVEKSFPSIKAGNPNAILKFKVFESETCPYCVAQNKVMDELLPEYGDLFYGEWYQVIDCQKESEQYRISGVPTFVFNADGVEKDPAYGFLDKQQMTDYICRVSGQC